MSETPRRQIVVLAVLLLVLAGAVAYQLWEPGPATEGTAASNPLAGTAAGGGIEPVADVRLDLLERQPDAYKPPQRNPFRFYTPPAPAPVRRAQPPPPPPPVPQGPIGPPPLPPIRIRYIGLIVPPDAKNLYAILRDDTTGAQSTAKAGDIIDGRYRLLSVTQDAVELAYLDGRGRQRIVRSGQ
jgi:hypothetical protein